MYAALDPGQAFFSRGNRTQLADRPAAQTNRKGERLVALSELDQQLLQRCLERKAGAWEDFVDRFLGLVVHVIHHTAQARSVVTSAADVDDLAAEVFLAIVQDDFAILRHFRGESSLATYLTVVARRVVVRELLKRRSIASLDAAGRRDGPLDHDAPVEQRLGDDEEVQRLLRGLSWPEADIVRLYHLEGKSYRDISVLLGIPENSIGPTLTRARAKMRQSSSLDQ
jgi:RNA polymerase sigma-70 factor, ECF subfamily